uniref:Uncharacterized protein n=1 Tax=Aegilops tauschii subsp. strangulata TaxID=200361 RepID=A0A453G8F8_AEGTS
TSHPPLSLSPRTEHGRRRLDLPRPGISGDTVRWACHRLQRQRRLHAYILPQRSHTHEACSHGRRACAASPALLGRMALLLTVWTSHILLLLLQDK